MALVLAGCSQPGEAARPSDGPPPANTRSRELSERVLSTGIVRPRDGAEVRVGSRISGLVERLHVGVGDTVQRGELLAELDATGLEARLLRSEAALASTQVMFDLAAQDEVRLQDLHSENIVPASELDRAVANRRAAAAQMQEAQAALEVVRIDRSLAEIRAPISGVVASVSTREGETVAASFSAPTFVTILDLDQLEVWAYVDETDIGRIAIGQIATFRVDTYPGIDFPGVVTAIQPAAEVRDNVVSYVTRLHITDRLGLTLRPEMTATVEVVLGRRSESDSELSGDDVS